MVSAKVVDPGGGDEPVVVGVVEGVDEGGEGGEADEGAVGGRLAGGPQ